MVLGIPRTKLANIQKQPKEEQLKFRKFVESYLKFYTKNLEASFEQEDLFKSLTQKAFEGGL